MLIVIGIEAFKVLRHSKKTLEKVDDILDDVDTITSSIRAPISKISELSSSFQQGINVINFITRLIDRKKNNTESDE